MAEAQTVWVHGEPVLVPHGSHVVHLSGARIALVASPVWQVRVLLGEGLLECPDEATNEILLAEHFPELAKEDSEKIPNFPADTSPPAGMP